MFRNLHLSSKRYFCTAIKQQISYGIVPFYVDFDQQIKYLLLLQKRGQFWFFPKGKPDPGETPLQTALRETFEEAGLERKDLKRILEKWEFKLEYNYKDKDDCFVNKTIVLFPGELDKDTDFEIRFSKDEIQDFKFVNFKQGKELLSFDSHKKLFSDIHFKLRLFLQS